MSSLRKIPSNQQSPQHRDRQWYTSPSMDLYLWPADDDQVDAAPQGFELYYDKPHNEHGLLYHPGQALRHIKIDDGEQNPRLAKASPIHRRSEHPADWLAIRRQLLQQAQSLEPHLLRFILQHLDHAAIHDSPRDPQQSGYYRWIEQLNDPIPNDHLPWTIEHQTVGYLEPRFAQHLCQHWPEHFQQHPDAVHFTAKPNAKPDETNEILATIAQQLADQGWTPGYWSEAYPLTHESLQQPLAHIDRAASARFGSLSFGQHLNGLVRKPDGLYLWLGQRAADRVHAPGKLDQLVAGGLPVNTSLKDNLAKECGEEAAIPAQLAAQAQPCGSISYIKHSERGLRRDTLYCYDLELPEHFQPQCTDGEVEKFHLLPIAQVAQIVRDSDDFKANCNLVILDLLIRHGLLDPEHPDYNRINQGLHRDLHPKA